MRVAVIAHALRHGGGLSVGRNLLRALLESAREDDRFLVTYPSGLGYEEIVAERKAVRGLCVTDFRFIARARFEILSLRSALRRFQPKAVLALGNRGYSVPGAVQLIYLHHPYLLHSRRYIERMPVLGSMAWLRRTFFRELRLRLFARSLKRADGVVVQTEGAERRLRVRYGYFGEVLVLPNALSHYLRESPGRRWSEIAYGRLRLVYLTAYYDHKNIEAILELFLRHGRDLENFIAVLTIDPKVDPRAARLCRDIERQGLAERIINVGPVRQEEIGSLFSGAFALLMPTLLESFSVTYLEAMRYQLPILTSDRYFAREICGEAALYFDPCDIESIYRAVKKLSSDSKLQGRLKEEGTRRLAHYLEHGWRANAEAIRCFFDGHPSCVRPT